MVSVLCSVYNILDGYILYYARSRILLFLANSEIDLYIYLHPHKSSRGYLSQYGVWKAITIYGLAAISSLGILVLLRRG